MGTEITWLLKNWSIRGHCDRQIVVQSFFISFIYVHCNVTLQILPSKTTYSLFPCFLNVNWLCHWLWPIERDREKVYQFWPRPQKACVFSALSLGTTASAMNNSGLIWWKMREYVGQAESAHLSQSKLQVCEWTQPRLAELSSRHVHDCRDLRKLSWKQKNHAAD